MCLLCKISYKINFINGNSDDNVFPTKHIDSDDVTEEMNHTSINESKEKEKFRNESNGNKSYSSIRSFNIR